jgi:probable rRNA maturation factor
VTVTIDFTIEAPGWVKSDDAERVVRAAIEAAIASDEPGDYEIGVVLSDDERVRVLNRKWREKDTATNVLSFPASDPAQDGARLLGDIVLALETIESEAAADGVTFNDHLAHLAVHGVLHLLGFDHERDDDAETMEDEERKILGRLGIGDPYAAASLKRTEPV